MIRFWKNNKGSVSLFLLIALTAILFFNAVLIDFARIWSAHLQAERAIAAGARSLLSVYDKELQEKYGLYGTNLFSGGSMKGVVETVVKNNVEPPKEASTNFLNLKLKNVGINTDTDTKLTLADRNVFTMQVLDDMKYKGPVEFSLAMLNPLSEMADNLKKNSSETKALDAMDKDNAILQHAINQLKAEMDNIQSSYDSTALPYEFIAYLLKKGFKVNFLTKLPAAPIIQYSLMYLRAQIYKFYLDKVKAADSENLADVANDPELKQMVNEYLGMYLIAKRWIEDGAGAYGAVDSGLKGLIAGGGELDKAIAASKRIDDHNNGGDPYHTRGNEGVYDNVRKEADKEKKDTKSIVGDKLKGGFFGSCSPCGQAVKDAQKQLEEIKNKKKKDSAANGGVSQTTRNLEAIKKALTDAKSASANLKLRAEEWKAPIVDGGKPVREGQEPFNFSGSKASLETAISQSEKKIAELLQAANPIDFKIEHAPADTFDAQKLKDYVSFAQLVTFSTGFESSFGDASKRLKDLKDQSDEAAAIKNKVMGMLNSISKCFEDLFNLGQFASSTANYQSYKSKYQRLKTNQDKFASASSSVSLKEIDITGKRPVGTAKDGGNMIDERMTAISGNLGADENLLINEYAMLRMKSGDLAKTDYMTYNLLFDEEIEYVIQGSHTPGDNYKALMGYTYLMRLGLNFAYMIVDKQYAAIRAIPFGIGYLILLVMAIFDSFMDMACLKQGERVPLWKGFEDYGWKYKDYLRFFLSTQGNYERKINRIMAVIQTKDPRFDLYTKYTRINIQGEFSLRLWFLPQVMKAIAYTGAIGGQTEGNRYVFRRSTKLGY